ncbi:uncharacterized protein LOC121383330 [Gigantopelta aegis]|uniref:uncharacterized protein LOC121383330 n=1 Tax=Gigantopelta aegis TaxID=1735272 RepID=UPI001B88D03A|nr:uncharacterized protein LOC121383330 [Gigantopelta aegis]
MKLLQYQIFVILCEIFVFLAYSTGEFATFAPNVTNDDCECPCEPTVSINSSKTLEEIHQEIQQLVSTLSVNKADVSATTRRKTSAKDHRPSAQSIGYVGIICLVASIGGIVILDLNVIYKDLRIAKSHLREIVNSSNQSVTRQVVTITADIPDGDGECTKPFNTENIKVEHED